MSGKARILILSLVAIVLGAGYLMRVIPPEAAVDDSTTDAIIIDGTIVTNPLVLDEFVPPTNPAAPDVQGSEQPSLASKQVEISAELIPTSGEPLTSVILASPGNTVFEGTFDGGETAPASPSGPQTGRGQPSPSENPFLTPPVSRPNAPTGPGSDPKGPDETGSTLPLPDVSDETGNDPRPEDIITLPTVPRDTLPGNPLPEKDTPRPGGPWTITEPPGRDAEIDSPSHRVPEAGSVIALLGLSLAAIAVFRKRVQAG